MTITIYHNPNCGTSRKVLDLVRSARKDVEIVEYLKTPPSRASLEQLISAMGLSPRALLREKGGVSRTEP